MKVIITGANGFIGKSLKKPFEDAGHTTLALGRSEMNLLDIDSVSEILRRENPDAVVHCAVRGGTRFDNDTDETYRQNVMMYQNLKSLRTNFGCLINIGSGAEFDRSKNLKRVEENLLFRRSPADFYGKAKNEIARDVVETSGFYNLRIFGCFGPLENSNRLLKIAFEKNSNGEDVIISNDKEMDYVHIDDLAKSILFFIENHETHNLPKDVNVVYSEKVLLSEIVDRFIPARDRRSEIKVGPRADSDYSGNESTMYSLGIKEFSLFSLKSSLDKYYNQLKELKGVQIE